MSALPTKRILVYVAVGVVVLVVGAVGIASAGGRSEGESVVIDAASQEGAGDGPGGGEAAAYPARTEPPVTTTEMPRIWVQVAGAVTFPGVYELYAGSRVFEAVAAAGGFSAEADEQSVALAALLSDGCRVYVPEVGESLAGGVVGPMESSAGVTGGLSEAAAGGMVSINAATAAELETLPGIGPSLAQQIISYRESEGPFTSVEQLTEVPGIGPAKMEQIRPLVAL